MIRLAESTRDFELCAEIFADVEPEERVTAEQLESSSGGLLLSGDDGYAYVKRSSVADNAYAMVRVRPSARRRGVGSALLAAAADHARELGRYRMWGRVHEPDRESLRFVTARGFREITRDIDIVLTVEPGDGAWSPGVVELTPEHLAGAYAVVVEAAPEMALPQIAAAPPFDEWVAEEQRLGAFAVVALEGDDVVGYAMLYRMPGHEHRLENGLTAVKRSHRRRGIATALKRAQIAWAAEHGYREICSSMVEGNAAMRGVNERLGYRELPALIVVEGWPG
jgi:GNAT superfamily N-acetyltransferase